MLGAAVRLPAERWRSDKAVVGWTAAVDEVVFDEDPQAARTTCYQEGGSECGPSECGALPSGNCRSDARAPAVHPHGAKTGEGVKEE